MSGYRLKLENEMMEHQAYLQLHMEGEHINHEFGPPEKASRFTWRDANLAKQHMKSIHKINMEIEMI